MDFDKELTAFKRAARKRKLCLRTKYGNWQPPFSVLKTQAEWEAWVAKARRADAHRKTLATEKADE